jgi:hypothetical protein
MWCLLQVSKTERRFGQCYVGRIIWCSVGMHGDGVVSIVTGRERRGLSLNPKRGRLFSFCHHHTQISSVAHPSACPMGKRDKMAGAWADCCQLKLMCVEPLEPYLCCHIHLHDTVLHYAQGELYLDWHLYTVWVVLIMHILNMGSLILILYLQIMKDFYFIKGRYLNFCVMFQVSF